jgi:hypothetical protein
MGFVVLQGRERMMGYGRFEDVVNALEGAVLRGEYLVGDSSTARRRTSGGASQTVSSSDPSVMN